MSKRNESDNTSSESETTSVNSEKFESESSSEEYNIFPVGKGEDDEIEFQKTVLENILISMGENTKTIKKILKLYESMYTEITKSKKKSNWRMLCLEFHGAVSYGK